MEKPEVYFRNHAFLQINFNDTTVLFDPWFAGSVFNNSWSPLADVSFSLSELRENLIIWISHEHPDHLHFPSLKKIREARSGRIRLLYRQQSNQNVREAITKLGFDFEELKDAHNQNIGKDLSICSFSEGADTACVLTAGETVILNQNDCLLGARKTKLLKRLFPELDVLFFQFSLAGYYANEDQPALLKAAHKDHLELVQKYLSSLKPKIYVPFASFVYFSKPGNSYLNEYRVHPREILKKFGDKTVQILWYDDPVLWNNWTDRNAINLAKWDNLWSAFKSSPPKDLIDDETLLREAKSFVREIAANVPRLFRPSKTSIFLRESKRVISLDFIALTAELAKTLKAHPVAEIGDDDLVFFFKYPWGADTLNITGNLKILDQYRWRRIAYLKHVLYVMKSKPPILRCLVAMAVACLRSAQHHRKARAAD